MVRLKALAALVRTPGSAGVLATLAITGLLFIDPFGLVTRVSERGFDVLYAALPRPTQTSNNASSIVVVDIDEATLAKLGTWPVPRLRLADLVDRLAAARVSAVGFDIFFPAADRHSPRALAGELSSLPGGSTIGPLASNMPDSDARFAGALRDATSTIGALVGGSDEHLPNFNFIKDGGGSVPAIRIGGVLGPYPPLADAALGVGIQSLWGEDEGLVRRVPLILDNHGTPIPGLALETARLAAGAPFLEVDGTRVAFGSHAMRLDGDGTMRLHWSDPSRWSERTVSALDVLENRVAATRLAGRIALIGSSAPEVGDLRPTSADPLTPSIQIQAEALEQLMSGTAPRRPPWIDLLELGGTLVLGLIATWLATLRGPLFGAATIFGLVVAWVSGAIVVFKLSELLVDPILPPVTACLASAVASAVAFAQTRRLKALISRRFEQYLAPDVVRAIIAQPDRLKLDGEMRDVTALFTDIEGFTTMTTTVGPKRLVALLDGYFGGVCNIVTAHRGMVDLIVGDAVHAFFNMPLDVPSHPDAAVECALAIVQFAEAYRQRPDVAGSGFGRTRIGIESGPAIVGDVGGPARFNYTAHGGVANGAARLEAANKTFGTTICIGPGAASQTQRTPLRKIGSTHLRGFPAPIDVFTPEALAPHAPARGAQALEA